MAGKKNQRMDIRICTNCGRTFEVPYSSYRKTCSKACSDARKKVRRAYFTEKKSTVHEGLVVGDMAAVCPVGSSVWLWRCACGREFERPESYIRDRRISWTCSHANFDNAVASITQDSVLENYKGIGIKRMQAIMGGKMVRTNTSGVNGIRIRHYPHRDAYQALIGYQGKIIAIGTYKTMDEAIAARKQAEQELFGKAIDLFEAGKNHEP